MLDSIRITGITGYGFHGVLDFERRDGQEFVVDLDIATPRVGLSAVDDDIDRTLDYRDLLERTHALITGTPVALIETLAERIAASILDAGASSVQVTVHKPKAPLSVPVSDVAVSITRRRIRAVIGLGANLGEAGQALQQATQAILALPRVTLVAASSIYRTTPISQIEQPDYCNGVLIVQADWDPPSLLTQLHRIEADFGRSRTASMGPRTLDLDLIDARDLDGPIVVETERCRLPHPRAAQRRFVLEPWAQIDPQGWLSWTGPVATLLAALGADQGVEPTADNLIPGADH